MLSIGDCSRFPAGVEARGRFLVDDVRSDSWPMNGTAAFVLERTGVPLGAIVDDLAASFGLPHERARADVLGFVLTLNAQLLLNIEHRTHPVRRWTELVRLAVRLAPAGMIPALPARRKPLDTGNPVRAVLSTLVAVAPRALLVAIAGCAFVALQVVLVAGSAGVGVAVAIGLAAGLGLALHEAGHAVALVGIPAALVLRGRRTFVLHRHLGPRRRAVVALAGPTPVAGLGAAAVALGVTTGAPLLALAGLAPAAHALSLTVAAGDGRTACGL